MIDIIAFRVLFDLTLLIIRSMPYDFQIGFSSNFFSTVFAATILYFFLENRITKSQEERQRNNLFRALVTELVANLIFSERIERNIVNSLTSDKFPISHFKVTNLMSFLSAQPFDKHKKLYLELSALMYSLDDTNELIDLIFYKNDSNSIRENKESVNRSAPQISKIIRSLLEGPIHELNKKYEITDEIGVPSQNND